MSRGFSWRAAVLACAVTLSACAPTAPDAQPAAESSAQAALEANKQAASQLMDLLWNQRNPEAAAALLAPDYIEHNPLTVQPGAAGFVAAARTVLAEFPNTSVEIKRIVAEGDLVVIHCHWKTSPDDVGSAAADIFRFADGKIVEHWDVIQPIPTDASQFSFSSQGAGLNPNGMF